MKTFVVYLGLSATMSLALLNSCAKDDLIEIEDELNQMQRNSNAVVYANLHCTTKDGKSGCECTITTTDDDCDMPTPCIAESYLPNYTDALKAMFTDAEIQYRTKNKVRITELKLIEALKKDKFPLK